MRRYRKVGSRLGLQYPRDNLPHPLFIQDTVHKTDAEKLLCCSSR
jgi:hypothetical protein